MDPLQSSHPQPPAARSRDGSAHAPLTGRTADAAELLLPPRGGPKEVVRRGDGRPPDLASLPGRVIEVVGGWAAGTPPRLPDPLREVLVRELTDLLVDATRREAYHELLRSGRAERAEWWRLDATRTPAELPLGEVAASGLTRLSDVALVSLALDPLHLEATAEVIDCLAESGTLGRVWWDAMARAGAAAYPDVSGAIVSSVPPAATSTNSIRTGKECRPATGWKIDALVRE